MKMLFQRNKLRLYVAIYQGPPVGEGRPPRYYWAFLIGPKKEGGNQPVPGLCHKIVLEAVNPRAPQWFHYAIAMDDVRCSDTLLARILVGKIKRRNRLDQIINAMTPLENQPHHAAEAWMNAVLHALTMDRGVMGRSYLMWVQISAKAMEYVDEKTKSGRYEDLENQTHPRPTWDMLQDREIWP